MPKLCVFEGAKLGGLDNVFFFLIRLFHLFLVWVHGLRVSSLHGRAREIQEHMYIYMYIYLYLYIYIYVYIYIFSFFIFM